MDTITAGITRIEAYRRARRHLENAAGPEAGREASLLISRAIQTEISGIFLYSREKLDAPQAAKANRYLKRRLTGMPLQYAMHTAYFMGLEFYVDRRVLIPRQETELLTEYALSLLRLGKKTTLDLCTGSGCIAVSLAALCPEAEVHASDIRMSALSVARKNAAKNGVPGRVRWLKSDLFRRIRGRYDVIVSNPPYVSRAEYASLEPKVRRYEPKTALLAGDGLDFYRRIAAEAGEHLNPGGAVLLEIGCNQAEDTAALLRKNGFGDIACLKDYGGRHRIITARK